MGRLPACKGCGKKLKPEEKHIRASKTYCKECFEKAEKDAEEYKNLIGFICECFNLEKPTGYILKQIKELKHNYKYSYASIEYTLWYYKEILNKILSENYIKLNTEQYYKAAESYYFQQEKLKSQIRKLSDSDSNIKTIIINTNNSPGKYSSLINLNNLLKGSDNY